ncbi:TRAFAC clade GTPase domain-containing protein [Micromonospora sp. DT229]|uniref:TRAFAC clade GTPase domain-containing protein n=1 Tax=Micromonospora sp. DT229 TaxID=3393430 RepID=UPI003CEEE071
MQIVLIVVAVLLAVALYLYLVFLALVFVATPLTLIGAGLGGVAGMGIVLHRAAAVLTGTDRDVPVRTPAEVVSGRLAGRVPARFVRRDFAWPNYFAVQVRLDLTHVASRALASCRLLVTRTTGPITAWDPRVLVVVWPFLVPVVGSLAGLTAGVLLAVVVLAVVFALVTGLAWLAGLAVAAVLTTADRAWQRVFRATGTCPRCYVNSEVPAYRCPGSHSPQDVQEGRDLHRNLRPGRLGVIWRRCGCGHRLPTTVLRAARSLVAVCPTCQQPLHRTAAVDTDIRIPVFGSASAGKTHLIMASLVTLVRADSGGGGSVVAADEHAERMLREFTEIFDRGDRAPKTSAAQQPLAVTVRIGDNRRGALLHVFDAAGEALADPDENARLSYLDTARTLLFVLDPFSIPQVRDSCMAGFETVFADANAATEHPEVSYQATAQRLRDHGVDTRRQRLGFVVSKRDLLERLQLDDFPGSDSSAVQGWLRARGLVNLVTAAERDFGEVRYFLVSSMRTTDEEDLFAPFRWLLDSEPVTLPTTTRRGAR